jgi:hypothetical protein
MPNSIIIRSLRELDALVAEKVFGWTDVVADLESGIPAGWDRRWDLYHYSSNIGAAWGIIEKFAEESQTASLQSVGSRWIAQLDNSARAAATAPLAICLAALKNEGIDIELQLKEDRSF